MKESFANIKDDPQTFNPTFYGVGVSITPHLTSLGFIYLQSPEK